MKIDIFKGINIFGGTKVKPPRPLNELRKSVDQLLSEINIVARKKGYRETFSSAEITDDALLFFAKELSALYQKNITKIKFYLNKR